ncbi:MAG: GNAT family protein [Bacteroidales bacterium]|nr:GNAT family protein [Bacteroidales bacterium]
MMKLDFKQNYTLENEVVLLRPLALSDIDNLIHFALSEPELWKYSLIQADGEEQMKNYIDLALKGREAEKEYPFIVFDKRTNSYAGSTRFYDIQLVHQTLQLGYTWYGKEFQGSGLNKHCKFLLLDFAFNQLDMERVEFRADNDNQRSIAAMKSIGCSVEGILRSNGQKPDGTRRDSIILSILKQEWNDELRMKLYNKLTK